MDWGLLEAWMQITLHQPNLLLQAIDLQPSCRQILHLIQHRQKLMALLLVSIILQIDLLLEPVLQQA